MAYHDDEKHFDPEIGEEFFFYKKHKRDKVWWVDYPNVVGNLAISFDKKKIIRLFRDYPWLLTNEQKRQFDEENPYWADYFRDRKGSTLLTGEIQKMKLHSNSICYGPEPHPDDEVEQHLSITRGGRVYFSSYVYGNERGRYRKTVMRNFKADPEKVKHIMEALENYFSKGYGYMLFTDCGEWTLEITNDAGEVFSYEGPLGSDLIDGLISLSNLVREELDMPNLYVFDGNYHEDPDDSEETD